MCFDLCSIMKSGYKEKKYLKYEAKLRCYISSKVIRCVYHNYLKRKFTSHISISLTAKKCQIKGSTTTRAVFLQAMQSSFCFFDKFSFAYS